MKKALTVVFATLLLSSGFLNAQNLSESLGAVKTNFQFYSGAIDLEVSTQFIIKNAGSYYHTGTWGDGAYGYGAGYESFRLEFVSAKPLFVARDGRRTVYYKVVFYDSTNVRLGTMKYKVTSMRFLTNQDMLNSPYFYSLDLYDTPISLLERTASINIVEERGK
jgi:hypothetical protein